MSRLPKTVSDHCERFLGEHGVRVLCGQKVLSAHEVGESAFSKPELQELFVTSGGHEIKADICYLCTGVTPNSVFLTNGDSSLQRCVDNGYATVNPSLQLVDSDEEAFQDIFVAGDLTNTKEEKLAQTAEARANLVLENIRRSINKEPLKDYVAGSKPMVISLGDTHGLFCVACSFFARF